MRIALADTEATESLGRRLAAVLPAAAMIHLRGPLGAGKTTLVRGVLRGLGYRGAVRSPTYTLIEPYDEGGRRLCHLDLYRLGDPEELEFIGLRDLLAEPAVLLVEWPERGAGVLPAPDLEIVLAVAEPGREARLQAATALGAALGAELSGAYP